MPQDIFKKALEETFKREIESLFEDKKKALIEDIDRRKNEIIAGLVLHLTSQVRMEMRGSELIVTIINKNHD